MFEFPKFDPGVVLAGLSGALVRAVLRPEGSWLRGLRSLTVGLLTAVYCAPLLIEPFELRGHSQQATTFITGFLAIQVLEFVEESWQKWRGRKQ